MTFGRTEPRRFADDYLYGPDIPDAFGQPGDTAPGDWAQDGPELDDPVVTEEDWLAHFLSMAINEAVHESLEWFRVDGKPYLDPHGYHEAVIYEYVNELAAELAKLARAQSGKAAA